jgi:hypothetical protein
LAGVIGEFAGTRGGSEVAPTNVLINGDVIGGTSAPGTVIGDAGSGVLVLADAGMSQPAVTEPGSGRCAPAIGGGGVGCAGARTSGEVAP